MLDGTWVGVFLQVNKSEIKMSKLRVHVSVAVITESGPRLIGR